MKYGEGIHRICQKGGFWYVGRFIGSDENDVPVYQQISNLYCFRGWAENFARRMKLKIELS